jgi:hypothetical protein
MPLMTSTPSLTPTPITEKGKGEMYHFNTVNMVDANQGIMSSIAEGTIPFTITHNPKSGVWEVKGSRLAAGTTEYDASKPSKISCSATWNVELTLSAILVPAGVLITDKEGCYMQLSIVEDWEKIEATCSTHLGTASGLWDADVMNTHGPFKFNLIEGEQKNQYYKFQGGSVDSTWRIETLDVPTDTGCAAGVTVPSGQ